MSDAAAATSAPAAAAPAPAAAAAAAPAPAGAGAGAGIVEAAAPVKIVVSGASGFIGKATLGHLVKLTAPTNVTVVTRNPASASAEELKKLGVHVVAGDVTVPATLVKAFAGATSLYVIVPGTEDRADLTVATIEAAKTAGVGHITVQSVSTAGVVSTLFGRQFHTIERATIGSGLPYTIVRLPLFTDNIWGQQDAIKGTGKFYYPVKPDSLYSSITTDNAGEAGAVIAANPKAHTGRIYNIVGPAYSNAELAEAFTDALGKSVEFVQVPLEGARQSFLEKGWPAWQVGGLLELFRAIDAGAYGYGAEDFKDITGKEATSIQEYVAAVKAAFL